MTTREQQIAAAREFVERNPEWGWDEAEKSLRHRTDFRHPLVNLSGGKWYAWHFGYMKSGKHDSPASAARALGFDVKE